MKKLFLLIVLFVFIGATSLFAQTRVITGTVTSAVEGEGPVPGVTVFVKGTTIATATDINGKYSPIQTQPDGEKAVDANGKALPEKLEANATQEARDKIANQKESNATTGQKFENCTQAFEAGVFNIKRSDASYQNKLDRDNDGIACER